MSYMLSIVIGQYGEGKIAIGFAFLIIAPFVHFFVYEVKNKNEYYFYYNLGLSKIKLWLSTFLIAFINIILLSLI